MFQIISDAMIPHFAIIGVPNARYQELELIVIIEATHDERVLYLLSR